MNRSPRVVAVLLGAVLCLVPFLRAQEGKDVVVGGERIGQVHLGMDPEAVEKLLGKPAFSDAAMGKGSDTWIAKSSDGRVERTEVSTHRDEDGHHWKVTQVAVTSPFFRTSGGNSTNSDLDALWREFPSLQYVDADIGGHDASLELYDDVASGVAFLIERTKHAGKGEAWGKCRAVVVHPKGQEVTRLGVAAPLEQVPGS